MRTSRKRAARIMRENGWAGTTRGCAKRPKGEARQAAPQANSAPDLVRRDFSADGPNRARFADIAYVRAHQGWPCLAVVMDVWSRKIVGWSISASMAATLPAVPGRLACRPLPAWQTRPAPHGTPAHGAAQLSMSLRLCGLCARPGGR